MHRGGAGCIYQMHPVMFFIFVTIKFFDPQAQSDAALQAAAAASAPRPAA